MADAEGCDPPRGQLGVFRYVIQGLLGTVVDLRVETDAEPRAASIKAFIVDELLRLEGVFSAFDDGSELSRWRRGELDTPGAEFCDLLGHVRVWQERSGGCSIRVRVSCPSSGTGRRSTMSSLTRLRSRHSWRRSQAPALRWSMASRFQLATAYRRAWSRWTTLRVWWSIGTARYRSRPRGSSALGRSGHGDRDEDDAEDTSDDGADQRRPPAFADEEL